MKNPDQEYKLSVCIPNYNRIERLKQLVKKIAEQIVNCRLEDMVEICVSDDCSATNPARIIEAVQEEFRTVGIIFERNKQNMGMDHNFLKSVLIAHGKYAWIVGNDDLPEEDALQKIISVIDKKAYADIDIMVTPFDSFDYSSHFVKTVYPLGTDIESDALFDTTDKAQWRELVMTVKDNSAVFGFLSNVVFKRSRWLEHGDMFADKMSSIFIQVYMNMQTLAEGARYLYTPRKIIRNFLDDETNQTIDRTYRIAAGLYDAMDYFFKGEERAYIEQNVVDIFMASVFMEFPNEDERKRKVDGFVSERMDLLKKYYVKRKQRQEYFGGKPVIVYGAGNFGHLAIDDLMQQKADIIGICDADVNKQGGYIQGNLIFNFDTLLSEYKKHENCTVVVANNVHLVPIIKNLINNSVLRIAVIT
ncbi:MAG: glycosyltransferase [Lachnospiraceae bacterium]|nr:glycosyltransferase [Lachnospiraceae bacterium]